MTDKQAEIQEQPTTKDKEANKNLERYAVLVWRIVSRCSANTIDRNLSDG
jgi:hypothetical protein